MRVMLVGDVIGRPGRRAFREYVQKLRREKKIDVVIVNGENSAAGKGLTRTSLDELYSGGADIITTGNHVWDKKDVMEFIDSEPFLIRPANYPEGTPGKGYCLYPFKAKTIGVMNLSGRTFMPALDCPFQKAEELLKEMQGQCDLLFLDFHAETTSEKMALGFYLDGRITGLVGTHTHIQTADERILPRGTAYITDLGMVGPWNSVLGVKTDKIIYKFTTGLPVRFEVEDAGPQVFSAVIVETDDKTDKAVGIERILITE